MASPLDGICQSALVTGASACLAAGADFAIFSNIAAQHIDLLVINFNIFIGAKLADFRAGNLPSSTTAILLYFIAIIIGHTNLQKS